MAAIRSIHIHQLLRLRDIKVDFAESGVTAIMGANGTGKTTLLQALACVYRNDTRIGLIQEQYRYTDFFKDYDGNGWLDSRFKVSFYGDRDGEDIQRLYAKEANGWRPMTQHKQLRYSKYISILECVPDQEKERERNIDEFTTPELDISDAKKSTLFEKASGALNRSYKQITFAKKDSGLRQFLHTSVQDRSLGEITYPSHYMGAGEQKIIQIMREVLKAPKNSLILIEELEISLHDSAIQALIIFLLEQANQHNLQIIFTTHWLRIQELLNEENMSIVSLYVNPETEVITVRDGFDPQFIHNLNNDYNQLRQVKVWVEDELGRHIVEHVAREMNVMPYLQIKIYGSIQNAYKIAGSASIMGENLDRMVILTDGDRYVSDDEKRIQIQNAVDGNGEVADRWREKALDLIVDLNTPEQMCPEQVILNILQNMIELGEAPQWISDDLEWVAQRHPVPTGKDAMNSLRLHKNVSIEVLEMQYIGVIEASVRWTEYTESLRNKLRTIVQNLGIEIQEHEVAA